jgi:hypothetical protein
LKVESPVPVQVDFPVRSTDGRELGGFTVACEVGESYGNGAPI